MEKKANEVLFSHHVALPAKWIYWQLWEIISKCNFFLSTVKNFFSYSVHTFIFFAPNVEYCDKIL